MEDAMTRCPYAMTTPRTEAGKGLLTRLWRYRPHEPASSGGYTSWAEWVADIEGQAVTAESARIRAAVEGLGGDAVYFMPSVGMTGEPMEPTCWLDRAAVLALLGDEHE
jgi:hypothetical protein